jgi:predicted O-linked N-acetylglucosamine transferase (SPINDLY family)
MRLLNNIEGSVLWLFEGNATAKKNLIAEAAKRGIEDNRLVFAPHMDLPEHLVRHRLADLFLDTFYCNAHTTASDALWAGLPLLTCIGETFAGRVSASLLNEFNLPELITNSPQEYEALAFELATNPQKLFAIREKLAQNRDTCQLFNTELFRKNIEAAYIKMWDKSQEGKIPDDIYIDH